MSLGPTSVTASLTTTFLIDFGIQLAFYIPSAWLKTERFYDLSGSLTYQATIIVALVLRRYDDALSTLSARQIIAAIGVLVWCTRLGIFLFQRVLKVEDKRFDELKKDPLTFAIPWFLQVVWIFLTALPVYIVLGNPGATQPALGPSDWIGIFIWLFGFAVEVLADYQKQVFKNDHPQDFVNTGIWRWSRYANYNGEITLWIGMFVLCGAGFIENWQWVAVISPIFVACLIVFVSGIAISDKNAEKRYGSRPDYQEYKRVTSKFFLWPPKAPVN